MEEKDLGLQEAIDYVIGMLSDRAADYIALKQSLPSFGAKVDKELARYLKALEHFVQGTVVWYYSPRKCLSCAFYTIRSEKCYQDTSVISTCLTGQSW